MKYDPSILIQNIIDRLEFEMTEFNDVFDFDDCAVRVLGNVQQEIKYTPPTYDTPPDYELTWRSADLEIWMATEDDERLLTEEELWYIEKQIDKQCTECE